MSFRFFQIPPLPYRMYKEQLPALAKLLNTNFRGVIGAGILIVQDLIDSGQIEDVKARIERFRTMD